MLGLDMTNFSENNTFPPTKETLLQKFMNLLPQEHVSFIHSLHKPEHLLQVFNFPFRAKLFQIPIQLILSMYVQIMGFNHDQEIHESFLGFILFLYENTMFNYPKFIADSIHTTTKQAISARICVGF